MYHKGARRREAGGSERSGFRDEGRSGGPQNAEAT